MLLIAYYFYVKKSIVPRLFSIIIIYIFQAVLYYLNIIIT